MANDRIYLRCKKCGKQGLLAKWWVSHFTLWEDGKIEDFLLNHTNECRAGLGHDLGGDPGFTLVTESTKKSLGEMP